MKVLNISKYQVLLDDEDYEKISKMGGWYIAKEENNNANTNYAKHDKHGRLHRYLLDITDSSILIDHLDRNGLNCQRDNLRIVTCSENKRNSNTISNNKFNFNGLSFEKGSNDRKARIRASYQIDERLSAEIEEMESGASMEKEDSSVEPNSDIEVAELSFEDENVEIVSDDESADLESISGDVSENEESSSDEKAVEVEVIDRDDNDKAKHMIDYSQISSTDDIEVPPLLIDQVIGHEESVETIKKAAKQRRNVLLIGDPGVGKSMLAKRLPSILPPFTLQESLETTKIHSVAGKMDRGMALMAQRPFRSPHHTISNVAMVGGGTFPQPGEISLSHNGVLFLDELPEFNRNVLEVMRQPLEDRCITISRARFAVDYPAGFMLIASMNPCPCGFYNHPDRPCLCSPGAVQKYMNRISGPLLDRIDIQIEIVPVPFEKISEQRPSESSTLVRERVVNARLIQEKRFESIGGVYCNAQMNTKLLQQYASPDEVGLGLLKNAMNRLNLSARAYDRILKVSRTIADLEGADKIEARHLAEAINYRSLDREGWGM